MESFGRTAREGRGDKSFTPAWLVEIVDALLDGIDTDPCWHPESHVRPFLLACDGDELGDGLAATWLGSVWVNPPYSKPGPWIEKCEAHAGPVIALLKCDTSTKAFAAVWRADVRVFFSKRLKFEGYGEAQSAPFASVLAVWNVDAALVRAAFEDLGHVDDARALLSEASAHVFRQQHAGKHGQDRQDAIDLGPRISKALA